MGKAMDALLSAQETLDDCREKAKYEHGGHMSERLYTVAHETVERAMLHTALAEYYDEKARKEADDAKSKHLS